MCLSASLGSKNLKKMESKTHPNSKARLAPKSPHFWSAERHFQSAKWHALGFWPDGIRVTLKHILFYFLAIRTCLGSYSDRLNYFFESSSLAFINRYWISKFSTLFYTLRFPLFLTPLSGILSLTLKRF